MEKIVPMAEKKEKSHDLIVLGERLRKIREGKKLSLKQLGMLIDKEAQSISRVENAQINPTYLYLLKLAKGLDMEVTQLLNLKENESL